MCRQGIWVGQESAGNFDLRIRNCEVRRNHQYGIQLSETDGFEVTGCTIKHNPVASKAGLGILCFIAKKSVREIYFCVGDLSTMGIC